MKQQTLKYFTLLSVVTFILVILTTCILFKMADKFNNTLVSLPVPSYNYLYWKYFFIAYVHHDFAQ